MTESHARFIPTDFYGTADAAHVLGIDRATLTRWVRDHRIDPWGKLPGANGALIFRRVDVDQLATAIYWGRRVDGAVRS
ncbi:MAG: helix-turn-helix domain-containing protein [Nocardioidaceae bacterium]